MFFAALAAMIGFQSDDLAQKIEFIRLSYKANKDAFAFGTFHFEYTRGSCATLSDAESGVFSKAIKEDGFYVFDGNNARYDLVAEAAVIAAGTTRIGHTTAYSASSFRALTDGEATLVDYQWLIKSDTVLLHRPEMYSGISIFYNDAYFRFPLWIGDQCRHPYDLYQFLTAVRDRAASVVGLDFDSHLDGLRVCKLSLAYKSAYSEGTCTYWIDLSRGCVPLRFVDCFDKKGGESTYIYGDLEHIPNAGWVPRRCLHILANGKVVDRIVVTRIDAQNKPRPSMFQLEFPQAVPIVDRHRKLVYAKQKSWSLLHLPSRSSPGTRPAILRPFNPPNEMPGEIEPSLAWSITVPAVIISAVISAAMLIARHRSKRRVGA